MRGHGWPRAFVLAISWSRLRLALFASFVILYFGGYPAIQFCVRHYFHLEFIGWAILAFLAERGIRLVLRSRLEERKPRRRAKASLRLIACAVLLTSVLLVPLAVLRSYQGGQVTRLLEFYVRSPAEPLPLVGSAPGQFRVLPGDRGWLRPGTLADGPRNPETRFVQAVVNGAACRPGTTLTFRYDPARPDDFSYAVPLDGVARSGPTRIFEAVSRQLSRARRIRQRARLSSGGPRLDPSRPISAPAAGAVVARLGGAAAIPAHHLLRRGPSMKTIVHVVGARPNYMKIAPLMEALQRVPGIRQVLVNTGQHYDEAMSRRFCASSGCRRPTAISASAPASHAVQTAKVMIGFEEVCLAERPDLVVVVGDVNSTMAASLVAAKLLIPIAHVEAGLRSFDRDDAGGDQPHRHRSAGRPAADAVARRRREPAGAKACRRRRFTWSATS